jgi:Sulfatase-modifying factor enzyme 1
MGMARGSAWLVVAVVLVGCGGDDPSAAGAGGAGATVNTGGASTTTTSSVGGQGGAGGGALLPDGSWEAPFLIDALPFSTTATTEGAIASSADAYWPCAPETSEPGPEVVYQLEVATAGWLWARLDDVPGDSVDVDVHLLGAPSPDACITRDDSWLGAPVQPGTHWIVVDTWGDASAAGEYELEVDLVVSATNDCLSSPIACDGMLPPFVNLDDREAVGDAGCLPGMTRVEDFCVDRYEAIVVALGDDGWTPHSPYAHPDAGATLMALSIEGMVPQGHISQLQAADACMMAGKRLCTDVEWLRACRGPAGTTYPYGDMLEAGRCNEARDCHPVVQLFESSEPWVWSELGHPCVSQLPEGLAPSGDYSTCTSAEGAMDMMGNLHEWTADPAGTFRGGFYVDTVINGSGCLYATTAHDVAHHDYSTGFRCCGDAVQ